MMKKAGMHKMPNGSMMKNSKMPKAEQGTTMKSPKFNLKGIETPTPGSENGKRGVGLDPTIQKQMKSGKLDSKGMTKKAKMGASMKKCKYGCK